MPAFIGTVVVAKRHLVVFKCGGKWPLDMSACCITSINTFLKILWSYLLVKFILNVIRVREKSSPSIQVFILCD